MFVRIYPLLIVLFVSAVPCMPQVAQPAKTTSKIETARVKQISLPATFDDFKMDTGFAPFEGSDGELHPPRQYFVVFSCKHGTFTLLLLHGATTDEFVKQWIGHLRVGSKVKFRFERTLPEDASDGGYILHEPIG